MTEAGPARDRTSRLVLLLAAGLAAFAAHRARTATEALVQDEAPTATIARTGTPAALSHLAGGGFWIGAWVGPPPDARDAATWRAVRDAGIDVTIGPLEDRYDRAANRARLAALDTLGTGGLTFVRDDSLHPDEATRPGWERRTAAVVDAYRTHRSLAGYFLADEPAPRDRAQWAPLARRLARLDPAHPAMVNFVGLLGDDAASPARRARWRNDLRAAIGEGELAFFTVDAYPFPGSGGESPGFLATLEEAARVARETGRPFGVVLQWTGHGPLRAANQAEARYQAMETLAHGASGAIWFTYWTPNPDEEPWRWHGGAVDYAGRVTARHDTLAALNAELRAAAAARGPRAMRAVHLGGDLPQAIAARPVPTVPHLVACDGGPVTVGFGAPDTTGDTRYVLVNRDRQATRRFRLRFDAGLADVAVAFPAPGARATRAADGSSTLEVTLLPGGGAVITARANAAAARPRTPSRSGTR